MRIVIDIPEWQYKEIIQSPNLCFEKFRGLLKAIRNGKPLPKGHGRIVDADTIALVDENFISQSDYIEAECAVDNAPTIIEADKENEK